ncbi:MAG: cupin domain-containing protein [Jiangellaceae bacterium]
MTYPPPTATYRPDETAPDLVYPSGTRVHYLSTGASTDGLFGLYRWECGPGVIGPAPHFHRSISESFYILSGVIRVYDGRRWLSATPGDYIFVPPGGVHAFRNESGEPASMLIHFAPGAPREKYFEGQAQAKKLPEPERSAFYREHDNIWL